MATERQRQIVLGALLVVLAGVFYRVWTGDPASTSARAPSSQGARGTRAARAAAEAPTAPDVRLQTLDAEKPEPEESGRNLFSFGQPPAPPAPVRQAPPPPMARPAPVAPGAGAPPAIPLRFIGIVEAPAQSKRIAALVDSTGRAYQGGEGDVIAGQYRVLKIGVESIELAYLDGRGRQTIRLSGS